ncbi:hypothetical protein K431DRAFT_275639 [Polychaeton citri CBS 116435]|uniref:Glycosyltransferase family 32 protein n=1 Tax=Polychaeton citri CBS 116435 TaxID=1314669 RepID=A0A9P4PZW0_9PEZI|nr:hypothetical protein K431DRAFT_275639 [Polychaeton citri CBS 116435]
MSGARASVVLIRNLALAAFLYAAIYLTVELAGSPSRRAGISTKLPGLPSTITKALHHSYSQSTGDDSVKLRPPSRTTVKINPYANTFNRPASAVEINDAYIGRRPSVDTEADLEHLVKACRGTYDGMEKVKDVSSCLQYLAEEEDEYYYLPEKQDRASAQDPRKAEYADADGQGNTLSHYPSYKAASEEDLGRCNGPIIPYHVYWSGPSTWKVEAFVKAYLYTQNLPCSRLWLWLDADKDPYAVYKFLNADPIFTRFLPLIERGDIRVLPWRFPTKIPLPHGFDHTDGIGYYKTPGAYDIKGERTIADGIVENLQGQQFLQLKQTQMTFFAQALRDAVRFVILHLHGGIYLDMDIMLLRDMRPMLVSQKHDFAERWAAYSSPGDFNTAVLSLSANSSLSSYLLRGGVRMGLNFHPRVIGRMALKDGRDQELLMLETAAFDPIWTEFNLNREGKCTVPCLKDYSAAFKGKVGILKEEWESYSGLQLEHTNTTQESKTKAHHSQGMFQALTNIGSTTSVTITEAGDPLGSWSSTDEEERVLRNEGVVLQYRPEEDKYPPNNRTMENFFRGAWTYHVNARWTQRPEPSSWIDVIQKAHDRFFSGGVNLYGESWTGPALTPYNRWPEHV